MIVCPFCNRIECPGYGCTPVTSTPDAGEREKTIIDLGQPYEMDWSIDTDDQRRLDAKKRADAAHTTGGGQPDWAKIKRLADEDTCGDCSEECHICIAILAAREMLKVAAPQAAVPESPKCRGNNPFCPCQDGDLCHYEGENPMAVPESQDGLPPVDEQYWSDVSQDVIEPNPELRCRERQLIATKAELRSLKLAASLACELHGCASAECTICLLYTSLH